MTDRKTSVGIVGAGYIAGYHLAALRALPDVTITAVCDRDRVRAECFAEAASVTGVYTDVAELLESERLDAVHVLTPAHAHVAPAEAALQAGVDVLTEKPLAHTVDACRRLREVAAIHGRVLGVSHNFLYAPVYQRLAADVRSGRFGRIEQVDIVWNKYLGQLATRAFDNWLFDHPANVLYDVAPHSFAHCLDLVGKLEGLEVRADDELTLPSGTVFFRRWEICGRAGRTSVRMRVSLVDGYWDHYIYVRGSDAAAHADFEHGTYVVHEPLGHNMTVDRFLDAAKAASRSAAQATAVLGRFVLSKAGLRPGPADLFGTSIARAVAAFYRSRGGIIDPGVSPEMGEAVVAMAAQVAGLVAGPERAAPELVPTVAHGPSAPAREADVLVVGGTGFIGRALVQRLTDAGHTVRVLSRRPPTGCDLSREGVELERGDLTDPQSVRRALRGIRHVFHLARGYGESWLEFRKTDVEPTRRLAEMCLECGVERLYYTSSISVYEAGKAGDVITEATPHLRARASNVYARAKIENETLLGDLFRSRKLPVVIFRPGIVVGRHGTPYHFGIAQWPSSSIVRLYGEGNNPLPFVLVDDVADAMVKAMDVPDIEGESFNLVGAARITANEYLDELERHAGIRIRRVLKPPWRAYVEALLKWGIKSLGNNADPLPTYAECSGRSLAATFDTTKAREVLGWSPADDRDVVIREGIHASADEFLG